MSLLIFHVYFRRLFYDLLLDDYCRLRRTVSYDTYLKLNHHCSLEYFLCLVQEVVESDDFLLESFVPPCDVDDVYFHAFVKLDNEQGVGKVRVYVEFGMDTLPHGWDMAEGPTPWKVVP